MSQSAPPLLSVLVRTSFPLLFSCSSLPWLSRALCGGTLIYKYSPNHTLHLQEGAIKMASRFRAFELSFPILRQILSSCFLPPFSESSPLSQRLVLASFHLYSSRHQLVHQAPAASVSLTQCYWALAGVRVRVRAGVVFHSPTNSASQTPAHPTGMVCGFACCAALRSRAPQVQSSLNDPLLFVQH